MLIKLGGWKACKNSQGPTKIKTGDGDFFMIEFFKLFVCIIPGFYISVAA
jgi:hypothetical protein